MGRLWRPRSEHQNGGFLKWGYPQIINFYGIFLGLFQWIVDLYGGFLSHRATPSHHAFVDAIFLVNSIQLWGYLHLFRNPPVIRTATEDGNIQLRGSAHWDIELCAMQQKAPPRGSHSCRFHTQRIDGPMDNFPVWQTVKFPEANCRLIFETLPEMIFFAYSSHQLCQEKHWV